MRGGEPSAHRGATRDVVCLALLCALAACVFSAGLDPRAPVVFGHWTQADVTRQFYPWRAFAFDELRRGSIPLWNPYVLCGYPFAASWQSAVFYPPNLPFLFLPVHVAINWSFAGHIALAGMFTFLFMRLLGGGRFAAAVAGVSFMLSSVLVLRVFAGHLSLVCAAAWFPALLASAEKWLRTRRAVWALLGGAVSGLQVLAGHPQVAYYSAAGCAFYLVLRAICAPRGERGPTSSRACVFLSAALVLGVSLSAVQLLPGLEFVRNSVRGAEAGTPARMPSFPPENLLTFLVPDALGDFVGVFCWGRRFLWGEAVYLGVLPLVLALAALVRRRDRTAAVLAVLALGPLALAMAAETPFAGPLLNAVPGLGVVKGPTKALFITVFALCCLAGLGAQCILGAGAGGRRVPRSRGLALALLLVAAACGLGALPGGEGSPAWRALLSYRKNADPSYWRFLDDPAFLGGAYEIFRCGMLRLSLLCAASAGALVFASRGKANARVAQAVVMGVIVADLWSYHARFLTTVPVTACRWPGDIVRFFAREGGFSRATRDNRVAVPGINQNMIDRIATLEGYETDGVRAFSEFSGRFRLGAGDAVEILFRPESLKMASLAGIRYLIVPVAVTAPAPAFALRYENAQVRIYENRRVLPRAFVVPRTMAVKDPQISLGIMGIPGFDPSSQAVLDGDPGIGSAPGAAPSGAVIERYAPREVVVRCRCETPGVLVLSDAYYPGWEVSVDGVPGRILRADHAFRGVPIGGGDHRVVFRYRPASFRLGAAVSLAALGALAVLGVVSFVRRRGGAPCAGR